MLTKKNKLASNTHFLWYTDESLKQIVAWYFGFFVAIVFVITCFPL